jgi:hypothetical protein
MSPASRLGRSSGNDFDPSEYVLGCPGKRAATSFVLSTMSIAPSSWPALKVGAVSGSSTSMLFGPWYHSRASITVPNRDLDRGGHAGRKDDSWWHLVDMNANRDALGQTHPREDRTDVGDTLSGRLCIRNVDGASDASAIQRFRELGSNAEEQRCASIRERVRQAASKAGRHRPRMHLRVLRDHRRMRRHGEAVQCCMCRLISPSGGVMFSSRPAMIQIEPAAIRITSVARAMVSAFQCGRRSSAALTSNTAFLT